MTASHEGAGEFRRLARHAETTSSLRRECLAAFNIRFAVMRLKASDTYRRMEKGGTLFRLEYFHGVCLSVVTSILPG